MKTLLALILLITLGCSNASETNDDRPAPHPEESISDDELLDLIQRRTFDFFWDAYTPEHGFYLDSKHITQIPANEMWRTRIIGTGSMGWGLTAMCIGDSHGWRPHQEIYRRVLQGLNSLYKEPDNPNDFCAELTFGGTYWFFNRYTGKRHKKSELASTSIAFLMSGVLCCMEHFKGTEIETVARKIYLHVEWDKFLYPDGTLSAGWYPEENSLKGRFKMYNEYCLFLLLGLGSPTHPLPDKAWDVWNSGQGTKPVHYKDSGPFYYPGHGYKNCEPSAYLYQMPACFIDFRNKQDKYGIDYWQMGINALRANRQICLDFAKENYNNDEDLWGWTACANKEGYQGYAHPYDGTISPSAVLASLPYLPKEAMSSIRYMYEKYRNLLFYKYGFVDGFNFLKHKWASEYFLAIDQGNSLAMIENYRRGTLWSWLMQNEYILKGLERAGFKKYK